MINVFGMEAKSVKKSEQDEEDNQDMIKEHMNQLGEVFSKYDKLVRQTQSKKIRHKSAIARRPPRRPTDLLEI